MQIGELQRSPGGRAERLIAIARAALAAAALLAIWFDPSEPSKYAATAYILLSLYLCYALLMLLLTGGSRVRLHKLGMVGHIIDLAAFTLMLFFTEGPTSPFFVFYVFSLFCAALRWQRSGIVWTALAALSLFIGLGLFMDLVLHDPHFELNRFIIRSVYLAGIALMLIYLTSYEQRTRQDMARLAEWRLAPGHADDLQSMVREMLAHAAAIMRAPRVLLLWDETEEPFRYLACQDDNTFQWQEVAPDTFEPPVATGLVGIDFFCFSGKFGDEPTICDTERGCRRVPGHPLHPELQSRFDMSNSLCLALQGEQFAGRLFFIGLADMTDDDLHLGGLVARQVEAAMSRHYLQQRLQQSAATETRVRLARDLHDGLLQSLTGIALQLEQVRRTAVGDATRERLGAVQALIVEEQRALRGFIQQIKPAALAEPAEAPRTLAELAASIERRWGVGVQLTLEPTAAHLDGIPASAVRYLLQEALANGAKHARATRIEASVSLSNGKACIRVTDNGQGFPFRGRYRLAELQQMQQGPRSLQERVIDLGGELCVESGGSGSIVEIAIPWPPASPRQQRAHAASSAQPS